MTQTLKDMFLEDLKHDRFVLPSLPEVALAVRRVLDDPEACARDIADTINHDPAIAAKILKVANSVFFRGRTACETVSNGVARIGLRTTRELVIGFAVKELFKYDTPELREATHAAWEHTMKTGAISHALARHTGLFQPEEAMIAGMLSQIGVLSVFSYVANYPEIYKDPERMAETVAVLKNEVGALVLDRWAMPADYLTCALASGKWLRDTGRSATLCDVVIVAERLALLGRRDLPQLDKMPAVNKLLGEENGPETAIEFMAMAREQIYEAQALLAA
jgi:HD-like signal output (HDOD) protein